MALTTPNLGLPYPNRVSLGLHTPEQVFEYYDGLFTQVWNLLDSLGYVTGTMQAHIADTAGDDATAVNAILDVLEHYGFVAPAP